MKRAISFGAFLILLFAFCPIRISAESSKGAREGMEMIALTFDDGPHPGNTERVLDVLNKYGVHATFFVLGCNIGYYPKPLIRAIKEGHEIENHSMDHITKSKDAETLSREIEKTGKLIEQFSGRRPRYFRPPEGKCPHPLSEALSLLGYEPVFWTIDSEDWQGKSPDAIVESVLSSVRGNDVILFHDYTCPNRNTIEAIDRLIPALLDLGYHFVTVEELKNKTASAE